MDRKKPSFAIVGAGMGGLAAAATLIEDAAVLARCLADVDGDDVDGAFRRYEAHRKPRTSRIQAISSANTWMKGGNEDTSWLYGYDAWTVPLTADATTVGAPDVINDAT